MPRNKNAGKALTIPRRNSAMSITATADELDFLRTATESIATAAGTLRAMAATFDADGDPNAEAADVAAGVRVGITHLRAASDALFSINPGEWSHKRANPLLEGLWDAADIVILVGESLAANKFPNGNEMTVCPIEGALKIAVRQLDLVNTNLIKLRELCNKNLTHDVRRHNREWRRQHQEARP